MIEKLNDTINYLKSRTSVTPEIGIVLGSGLGGLLKEVEITLEIPYSEIPHFPVSTVEFHSGKLVFGKIGDKSVVIMNGRFHYYEGYSMQEVTYPIRVMKLLGINTLILSNASGSINFSFKKGEIVLIDDHINLQTSNPLTGTHDPSFGPRFPDMSAPYNKDLIHKLWVLAKDEGMPIHKGVYAAVNGPNQETRAEYKYLRTIGADIVGMSTVPEVIVARQMGLEVCALSLVTDECYPDELSPVTVEEILAVAAKSEPLLTKLISRLLKESL